MLAFCGRPEMAFVLVDVPVLNVSIDLIGEVPVRSRIGRVYMQIISALGAIAGSNAGLALHNALMKVEVYIWLITHRLSKCAAMNLYI